MSLFAQQVARTPHHVALYFEGRSVTYRELDVAANGLAIRLLGNQLQREELVAVSTRRSPDMVVAVLGIMKAGAAWVPVEPTAPRARTERILDSTGVRFIVTDEGDAPVRFAHRVGLHCVALGDGAEAAPDVSVGGDDLAYVIHTSGSTGEPKGVLGLHRGSVNRLRWMWREFPFQERELGVLRTSLGFGDAIWEIFGPLLQGVPSVIASHEVARSPRELIELLEQHQVTRIVLVPSLLRAMIAQLAAAKRPLTAMRYCTSSGEHLPAEIIRSFHAWFPQATLLNLYGSSEVSADASWVAYPSAEGARDGLIGRPLSNVDIYVLDPYMRLQPVGLPGEIHVGGVGLSRGYLNAPELTAQKFVTHPFRPDARLYKTGDLGRWLPDGRLMYLGRVDQQLNIRGFRVEPGEIEHHLRRLPAVESAVVIGREDSGGATEIIAYLVPRAGASLLGVAAMRAALAEVLPPHMMPALFVPLAVMPVTRDGKVDKRALPDARALTLPSEVAYVAPRTAVELWLCALWERLLPGTRVGVHDNFFDLGGHSLKAVAVSAEIHQHFGLELPLQLLFQHRVLEDLAAEIGQLQDGRERFFGQTPTVLNPGPGPYVFALPPVFGAGVAYRPLAEQLAERTVVAFDFYDYPDLISWYRERVQEYQPTGPYVLMGYSAGGRLAFELCKQLEGRGEIVSDIVMLDVSARPHLEPLPAATIASDAERITEKILNLPGVPEQERALLAKPGLRELLVKRLTAYGHFIHRFPTTGLVSADIHLIRSTQEYPDPDPRLYWSQATSGRFDVYQGVGGHFELLSPPHLTTNARIIGELCERIFSRQASGPARKP